MNKKMPVRRCVGCQEMKNKREMIRVIRTPEGEFFWTLRKEKRPRSIYLSYPGMSGKGCEK